MQYHAAGLWPEIMQYLQYCSSVCEQPHDLVPNQLQYRGLFCTNILSFNMINWGNNFLSLPPLEIRSPGPSLHLVFWVLGTRSPGAKSRDGDQIPRTRSPSGIFGTEDQVSRSKRWRWRSSLQSWILKDGDKIYLVSSSKKSALEIWSPQSNYFLWRQDIFD